MNWKCCLLRKKGEEFNLLPLFLKWNNLYFDLFSTRHFELGQDLKLRHWLELGKYDGTCLHLF
jgi:hypothetical protein